MTARGADDQRDKAASRRGWGYRLLLLLLLAANGWAQYVLWFGQQGLVRWLATEKQLTEVQREVHQVEQRLHRLEEEIRLVESDPLVLEEVARRELGLVYPDEILLVLPQR